jgi:hypothetical protein
MEYTPHLSYFDFPSLLFSLNKICGPDFIIRVGGGQKLSYLFQTGLMFSAVLHCLDTWLREATSLIKIKLYIVKTETLLSSLLHLTATVSRDFHL